MLIIPIGVQCTTATFKNEIEKTHTFPFDWMLSHPSFVFKMFELLLEENIDIDDLVRNHFLCCNKRATNHHYTEHYYTCNDGCSLYNTKYNVIFPHDKTDDETVHKYTRRFERLKNAILNSTEKLCFMYVSQSSLESGNFTIDGNVIIKDVYVHISKIYELIGRFRTHYEMVIFDAIQNEQMELLNGNITLFKLNKYSNYIYMLPEMRNHTYFFKSSFFGKKIRSIIAFMYHLIAIILQL